MVTAEQLDMVRAWAAAGVDLNGIQKNLAAECGVHMTYMDVRFLLLDYGIEIAVPSAAPAPEPAAPAAQPAVEPVEAVPAPAPAGPVGKPVVTLDELMLPGTLISGKVQFSSGTKGGWQIDQLGRFAWNSLEGQPTPEELQAFQMELQMLLSRGGI